MFIYKLHRQDQYTVEERGKFIEFTRPSDIPEGISYLEITGYDHTTGVNVNGVYQRLWSNSARFKLLDELI